MTRDYLPEISVDVSYAGAKLSGEACAGKQGGNIGGEKI